MFRFQWPRIRASEETSPRFAVNIQYRSRRLWQCYHKMIVLSAKVHKSRSLLSCCVRKVSTTGSAGTDIPSNNVRKIVLLTRVRILDASSRGLGALRSHHVYRGLLMLESLGLL